MKRRQFIACGIAGSVVAAAGGLFWIRAEGQKIDVSIDSALAILDNLSGKQITGNGVWHPYRVFTHCAQSIEYSMTGYPQQRSTLFKNTVGKTAFSAFRTARKMTHVLDESIPGAPEIPNTGNVDQAISRLKKAYLDFQHYDEPLSSHFAYGELNKQDYATAHVIHLYNHLTEITVSPT